MGGLSWQKVCDKMPSKKAGLKTQIVDISINTRSLLSKRPGRWVGTKIFCSRNQICCWCLTMTTGSFAVAPSPTISQTNVSSDLMQSHRWKEPRYLLGFTFRMVPGPKTSFSVFLLPHWSAASQKPITDYLTFHKFSYEQAKMKPHVCSEFTTLFGTALRS